MNLTFKQKKLFKDIFIGIPNPNDDGYIVKPMWVYLKGVYKVTDNETVAIDLFYKLVEKGVDFNYSYFKMAYTHHAQKEYIKHRRQEDAEMRAYRDGHIEMNTTERTGLPIFEFISELTKGEKQMVDLLKEGLNQREIYKEYKIHPATQAKLRKQIKNKIKM